MSRANVSLSVRAASAAAFSLFVATVLNMRALAPAPALRASSRFTSRAMAAKSGTLPYSTIPFTLVVNSL